MTNTHLHDMLTAAAKTGELPTDEELDALVIRRQSVRQVDYDRRAIRRAAQDVIEHAQMGHRRMLAGSIAGAVEEFAEATGAEATDPRALAAASNMTGFGVFVKGRDGTMHRSGAKDISHRVPLHNLLRGSAGSGEPVTQKDIDRLLVNPDLSARQKALLAAEVLDASKEIASLRRGGNHQLARQLAEEVTGAIGDHLINPPPIDTDDMTPDQLADLVGR